MQQVHSEEEPGQQADNPPVQRGSQGVEGDHGGGAEGDGDESSDQVEEGGVPGKGPSGSGRVRQGHEAVDRREQVD